MIGNLLEAFISFKDRFEEPGLCDNAADGPYSASTPEAVLDWLRHSNRIEAA